MSYKIQKLSRKFQLIVKNKIAFYNVDKIFVAVNYEFDFTPFFSI